MNCSRTVWTSVIVIICTALFGSCSRIGGLHQSKVKSSNGKNFLGRGLDSRTKRIVGSRACVSGKIVEDKIPKNEIKYWKTESELVFVLHARILLHTSTIGFKGEPKKLQERSSDGAYYRCGQGYVSKVVSGAQVTLSLAIEFTSYAEKGHLSSNFKRAMKESGDALLAL